MSDITFESYEDYVNLLAELEEDVEISEEEFYALSEEELVELEKKTLKSYKRKAETSRDRAWAKADKEEDKSMSTDGEKYPEKQKRHMDNASKAIDTANKREKGLKLVNKKLAKEETEMEVEENTAAAASLQTHGVQGKADAMSVLLGHMNGMSKGEAIDFFHKVMGQFGPGKEYGVGDNSAQNSATIDSKLGAGPKLKEDVEEMFAGQDLSEEFKERAAVLFEAAVSARLIAETARLEEEFETALEEAVSEISEDLTDKVNAYLDYVTGEWMAENQVAIESTLRNEVMEDFIGGLKGLFAEHYISVPETKIDVLESLAAKVDELEEKLDEAISENVELRGVILEDAKVAVFAELASDLALTQQEKFAALAEGIEFDGDLDVYSRKLEIIKENYFAVASVPSSHIEDETFEGNINEGVSHVDPNVSRYAQALSRTVKNK